MTLERKHNWATAAHIVGIIALSAILVACAVDSPPAPPPVEHRYVSTDPQECMVIKFMCEDGMRPFFDDQGCGCTDAPQDDIQQEPVEQPVLTTVTFSPMQCERTPWHAQYPKEDLPFITMPVEDELIPQYYRDTYGVELTNVQIVQRDGAVCEACNICPQSYYVTAQTSDAARMIELGWAQ
jgi:hypothetical protein